MEYNVDLKRKQNLCRFITNYNSQFKTFEEFNRQMVDKIIREKADAVFQDNTKKVTNEQAIEVC